MNNYILDFLSVSFLGILISALTIPLIITIVRKYNLLDNPNSRSAHRNPIPTMGGMAILLGTIMPFILVGSTGDLMEMLPVILAFILMSSTGLYDDIRDIDPKKKFFLQFIAATILYLNGFTLENMQGLFGLYYLPVFISFPLTILFIVGITNAINLMDGINGLAGGIIMINMLFFAYLFYSVNNIPFALLALSGAGATLGFLFYNFNPARIFMGDTGSLFLGLAMAVFALEFIGNNHINSGLNPFPIAMGLVILPSFDMLRVFLERINKKKSPFKADKTHLHHLLLDLGFKHAFSSVLIYGVNVIVVFNVHLLGKELPELALSFGIFFSFIVTMIFRHLKFVKYQYINNAYLKNLTKISAPNPFFVQK